MITARLGQSEMIPAFPPFDFSQVYANAPFLNRRHLDLLFRDHDQRRRQRDGHGFGAGAPKGAAAEAAFQGRLAVPRLFDPLDHILIGLAAHL
ncbi:hypothetical protein D3C84_586080 [compost metagenome]